jgi:hypothetical protein
MQNGTHHLSANQIVFVNHIKERLRGTMISSEHISELKALYQAAGRGLFVVVKIFDTQQLEITILSVIIPDKSNGDRLRNVYKIGRNLSKETVALLPVRPIA